jgi:hypothetical protein
MQKTIVLVMVNMKKYQFIPEQIIRYETLLTAVQYFSWAKWDIRTWV